MFGWMTTALATLVRRAGWPTAATPTRLGRWNRCDNVDIKASLANVDSCGDRLCGDTRETRAIISKYAKSARLPSASPIPLDRPE